MVTKSIRTSFFKLLLPALAVYSIVAISLFAWNDFKFSEDSRKQSQELVFEAVSASLQQPLIQGSTVEAKIRIEELLKNPQVRCIDLTWQGLPVSQCPAEHSASSTYILTKDFSFAAGKPTFASIRMVFDNSDLSHAFWEKSFKIAGIFAIFGILLALILTLGFNRIRNELSHVLKQAQGSADDTEGFRISEFKALSEEVKTHMLASKASAEAKAALLISQQVAHDIRSPLQALKAVTKEVSHQVSAENAEMLQFAVQRINEVSDDLAKRRDVLPAPEKSRLPSILNLDIKEVVSEKRIQFPAAFVTFQENTNSSRLMTAKIAGSDMRRILSALLENAVQALAGKGIISITTLDEGAFCKISIRDDGIGVPADILPKLFVRGATFGKPGGKGLGLFWAREVLENAGGSISISSEKNVGTIVNIEVPLEPEDSSRVIPYLNLADGMRVLVIDDDKSIFLAWKHKLKGLNIELQLDHVMNGSELSAEFLLGTPPSLYGMALRLRW